MQRNALAARVQDLERKTALLQTKFTEEKALAAQLLRAKSTSEGQSASAQAELEQLKRDASSLREESKRRALTLEQKANESAEAYARLKAERDETERHSTKSLREQEEQVKRLAAEKDRLERELAKANEKLSLYGTHNAKLCVIATELLEAYEKKGVLGALLQKEPFLQVKRVEVERLVQEYRDRIEQNRLKKGDG